MRTRSECERSGHGLGLTYAHGMTLIVWTFLTLLVPTAASAQSIGPFYPQKLNLLLGIGYSRARTDPKLPRDLKNHDNHPDDAIFLTGSPGTTDLRNADINAVELEVGLAYRLGFRNFAVIAMYVPKIPISSSGRLEIQQINDPRPPAMGSFIYSQFGDVGVGHAARTGLAFAVRLSEGSDWWLETQGLVDLGRWDMTFQKGWSRFGRDQPAIVSEATGFEISPQVRVALATGAWSLYAAGTYSQIRFDHGLAHLETHTGSGLKFGLGGSLMLPRR